MYCFHASDPDSLPPPVAFSPPNAPPISAKESVTLYNFETIASHVYLCRKQDPTCSWSGNIHIHDSTVWSLGAKPLEGKEKNVRFVVCSLMLEALHIYWIYPPGRHCQYPLWISKSWDPAPPRCSNWCLRQSWSTSAGRQWEQKFPCGCK